MRDIERRLRESLQARAGDVEPTPVLWERVHSRVRRDRWWTWTLAAASTAAVALAAVLVVPGLIDGQRDVEILSGPTASPTSTAGEGEPTAAPTEGDGDRPEPDGRGEETVEPTSVGALSHLVVTDRTTITLVDAAGEPIRDLVALPAEGESTVVSLEVRPGSTADDLTVVFATEGEGMVDLRWVRLRDGAVEGPEYFTEGHQVSSDVVANGTLTPTFSPDGRHLAWLEVPRGEPQQPARLRTIGWAEGPGTGSAASDNAGFELEPVATEHPLTLEDWIWDEVGEDGTARGELRAVGPAGLYHITIERQGDGALAVPSSDGVRLGGGGDGAVIDIDNAYAGDEAHPVPSPGPEYQLLAKGDGSGDAEGIAYTLLRQPPGGPTVEWPLPDLGPTADPWGTWMNAHPDAVVLGVAGDAWLVTEDGATSLSGTIHWADVVR